MFKDKNLINPTFQINPIEQQNNLFGEYGQKLDKNLVYEILDKLDKKSLKQVKEINHTWYRNIKQYLQSKEHEQLISNALWFNQPCQIAMMPVIPDSNNFFNALNSTYFVTDRQSLTRDLQIHENNDWLRISFAVEIFHFFRLAIKNNFHKLTRESFRKNLEEKVFFGFLQDSEADTWFQLLNNPQYQEIIDLAVTFNDVEKQLNISLKNIAAITGEKIEVYKTEEPELNKLIKNINLKNKFIERKQLYNLLIDKIISFCSQKNIFSDYVNYHLKKANGSIVLSKIEHISAPMLVDAIAWLYSINICVWQAVKQNELELILTAGEKNFIEIHLILDRNQNINMGVLLDDYGFSHRYVAKKENFSTSKFFNLALEHFKDFDLDLRNSKNFYTHLLMSKLINLPAKKQPCLRYVFEAKSSDTELYRLEFNRIVQLAQLLNLPAYFILPQQHNQIGVPHMVAMVYQKHLILLNICGLPEDNQFYEFISQMSLQFNLQVFIAHENFIHEEGTLNARNRDIASQVFSVTLLHHISFIEVEKLKLWLPNNSKKVTKIFNFNSYSLSQLILDNNVEYKGIYSSLQSSFFKATVFQDNEYKEFYYPELRSDLRGKQFLFLQAILYELSQKGITSDSAIYERTNTPEKWLIIYDPALIKQKNFLKLVLLGKFTQLQTIGKKEKTLVSTKDENNKNALLIAGEYGHLSIMQYLDQQGEIFDHTDSFGNSVIEYAVSGGHVDILEYLVNQKKFSLVKNDIGTKLLFIAAEKNRLNVIKWLFVQEKKLSLDVYNKDGKSLTLVAAGCGSIEVLMWLVDEKGQSLNQTDTEGFTPLLLAVANDHMPTVKWLVEVKGMSLNQKTYNKYTALLIASNNGHFYMVCYLLDKMNSKGLSILDQSNNFGDNALMLAAYNGHTKISYYLTENYHMPLVYKNNSGESTVLFAVNNCLLDFVKWMVEEKKISLKNFKMNNKFTLVYDGSYQKTLQMMRYLIEENKLSYSEITVADKREQRKFTSNEIPVTYYLELSLVLLSSSTSIKEKLSFIFKLNQLFMKKEKESSLEIWLYKNIDNPTAKIEAKRIKEETIALMCVTWEILLKQSEKTDLFIQAWNAHSEILLNWLKFLNADQLQNIYSNAILHVPTTILGKMLVVCPFPALKLCTFSNLILDEPQVDNFWLVLSEVSTVVEFKLSSVKFKNSSALKSFFNFLEKWLTKNKIKCFAFINSELSNDDSYAKFEKEDGDIIDIQILGNKKENFLTLLCKVISNSCPELQQLILDNNLITSDDLIFDVIGVFSSNKNLSLISIKNNLIRFASAEQFEELSSLLRNNSFKLALNGNYIHALNHQTPLNKNFRLLLNEILVKSGLSIAEWAEISCDGLIEDKENYLFVLHHKNIKYEIKISTSIVKEVLNKLHEQNLINKDEGLISFMQEGISQVLGYFPELNNARLSERTETNRQSLCHQLLYFHPKAPLKYCIARHTVFSDTQSNCLWFSNKVITDKKWWVFLLSKNNHASLAIESLNKYGQKDIFIAELWFNNDTKEYQISIQQKPLQYYYFKVKDKHWIKPFSAIPEQCTNILKEISEEEKSGVPLKYQLVFSMSRISSKELEEKTRVNCLTWSVHKIAKHLALEIPLISPFPDNTVKYLMEHPEEIKARNSTPSNINIQERKEPTNSNCFIF